jgi:transcriptional regulator with XRE-family HTH domain
MSFSDLVERVAKLPPPVMGESQVPPPELTGFFVRWVRGMKQLKKAALASMAGVSLSTVERIERGDPVNPESLDSVGVALGYERGYLTSPREPIQQTDAMQNFVETYEHLVPIKVAPLRTQSQVRALAQTHTYLPFVPEEDEEQRDALYGLIEWIDLAAFMITDNFTDGGREEPSRRKLYGDILGCVGGIERQGWTVLAGVMEAARPGIPEWKMAVFSITSKSKDPGALKRNTLLVDKRFAHLKPGPFPWET